RGSRDARCARPRVPAPRSRSARWPLIHPARSSYSAFRIPHSAFRSPVAGRAVGQPVLVDVVVLLEPPADGELVALRLVAHREDLVARAQEALGLAVAGEAPAHGERL